MMKTLDIALKISLVLFMVGNLLDMGLRLKLKEAIGGLRNVRFVALSLLWGFILLPGLAYLLTVVVPLKPPYAIGVQILFFSVAAVGPHLLSFGLPQGQKSVLALGMCTRNIGAALAPLFAVPEVDQRAIVRVAFGVLMQATFSFAAATYFGRRAKLAEPVAAPTAVPTESSRE